MPTPKTPMGLLRWNHLYIPQKAKNEDDQDTWSIEMLWPADTNLKEMLAAATAAKEKKFGTAKIAGFKSPFTLWTPKGVGQEKYEAKIEAYPEYDGMISARLKTTFNQPGVVGPDARPIMDRSEIYNGCYVIASYGAYAYDFNGSKGAAFGLINVMKMKDGTPLSAMSVKAEEDFKEIKLTDYGIDNSAMFENDLLEAL